MRPRLALPLAALLGLAGTAAHLSAAAPGTAAAQRDWSKAITATADGGYRIGNPAAAVKLVEYGSLTCSHCATFAEVGVPQLLSKYVRSGRVSFEFRNFVRDPADMAAALLSRCVAPARYFSLTDRYFRSQTQWMGRIQAMSEAQLAEIAALSPHQQLPRFAALGGLEAIAAQDGVAAARAPACLTDQKATARLVAMRKVAIEQHGLKGTPTFLINGKKADTAYDWATVEPLLGPPGG